MAKSINMLGRKWRQLVLQARIKQLELMLLRRASAGGRAAGVLDEMFCQSRLSTLRCELNAMDRYK